MKTTTASLMKYYVTRWNLVTMQDAACLEFASKGEAVRWARARRCFAIRELDTGALVRTRNAA